MEQENPGRPRGSAIRYGTGELQGSATIAGISLESRLQAALEDRLKAGLERRSSFPPHLRFSLIEHVLIELPEAVVFSAAVDADAVRVSALDKLSWRHPRGVGNAAGLGQFRGRELVEPAVQVERLLPVSVAPAIERLWWLGRQLLCLSAVLFGAGL